MNRKTEIIDDEILEDEVIDEIQDEIFEKLKDLLIQENRLVQKFYNFCEEFNHFAYDEMGMNVEEADDILRKANIIRDKLLNTLMELSSYKFINIKTDEVYCKILFDIIIDENTKHCIIEADIDSFNLEVY